MLSSRPTRLSFLRQPGNRLEGALGARYHQALSPYADFAADRRNLRRQRRARAFKGKP